MTWTPPPTAEALAAEWDSGHALEQALARELRDAGGSPGALAGLLPEWDDEAAKICQEIRGHGWTQDAEDNAIIYTRCAARLRAVLAGSTT